MTPPEPAYRFVYEVRPTLSNPDYGHIDGGFASCWVLASSHADAAKKARTLLAQLNYRVGKLDSSYLETAESNPPGSPGRTYLDQVQTDGIVVTIHEWGTPDH